MAIVFLWMVLLSVCGRGLTRSVETDDDVVSVVSGTLYALEPLSGETQHRLTRRHLGDMDDSQVQAMRLDLGPEVAALDMELRQDSVWTDDSQVLVRRGEQAELVHGAVDSSCFLSGPLRSQDGAASLNRCGRLSGMIQTGDFHYEIEEAEGDNTDSELSNVNVIMRRSQNISAEQYGIIMDDLLLGTEHKEEEVANDNAQVKRMETTEDPDGPAKRAEVNAKDLMRRSESITTEENAFIMDDIQLGIEVKDENPTIERAAVKRMETEDDESPVKRQGKEVIAEVAAFLDANFANYMSRHRGKKTVAALTQWIVMKWNIIRNVYGNSAKLGVPFKMALKKVEVWWKNPAYYARLGKRHDTDDFLRTFCQNSGNNPNYDHKMLYTQGTGGAHMGMAFLNGICRSRQKCSLVKAKADDVKIELHEFGHNVGLEHDPDLRPCNDPQGDGGFMGWGSNYRILDCYRRDLLKHIKEPGARCLYQRNVNLNTLNPSAKAKKKTSNKKKQGNNTNGCY